MFIFKIIYWYFFKNRYVFYYLNKILLKVSFDILGKYRKVISLKLVIGDSVVSSW